MQYKSQTVHEERIKYLDFEGEGNPVVFTHGIGKKPIAYKKLLEEIANKGYRVIAPEMYGRNYLKNQPRSIEEYAKLTCDFISALELKNIYLIGHSLGGIVSFKIADNYPYIAKKIVALSPGLPMNREGLSGILRGASHYFNKRIRTPFKSLAFFISNTLPVNLHLLRNPKAWAGIVNDVRKLQSADFNAGVPSLILHAENDELIELDYKTEKILTEKGVAIKRLQSMDHNWPISNYSLATSEIHSFLNNLNS